jgi:hypothetical protein
VSDGQQEIQVIKFYVIKLWCKLLGSSKSIEVYALFKSLNGLEWIVRQILRWGFTVGFLKHWWLEVLKLDNGNYLDCFDGITIFPKIDVS